MASWEETSPMSKEKSAPGISPRADWRDPERYKSLLDLDRIGWAWEWLRRNPDFATTAGRLSRRLPPSAPPGTERPVGAPQPRINRGQEPTPFERWGVWFHRPLCPARPRC